MTALPPAAEAVARRARAAARDRRHPAIAHPPGAARGCGTCGLPTPRSRPRCPSCEELREAAAEIALTAPLLAARDDGRALAERIVVAAALLDLDRDGPADLVTPELIEAGLTAEIAALRFALSRVPGRRAIVTREAFGHLLAPHLRAAGLAVLAPHERRGAAARLDRGEARTLPPRTAALSEALRGREPSPGGIAPDGRVRVADTLSRRSPEALAPGRPSPAPTPISTPISTRS